MLPPLGCWSRLQMASATISERNTAFQQRKLLVDKAQLLTLSAPEMTALVGGMRVLGAKCRWDVSWCIHRPGRDT